MPQKPNVADFVVLPKVTERLVKTCKKPGIEEIRLQQDSECETAINFCKENSIDVVHEVCVMVKRRSTQR